MNETKEKTAITRRDAMDMLGGMLFTPICVVTDYKTAFDGSNEPIYEIGGNGTVKQTLFTIKNAKQQQYYKYSYIKFAYSTVY